MMEKLVVGAFAISVAMFWAGYTISCAVKAASDERRKENDRLMKVLLEMSDQLRWTKDSVKRVEERLPRSPEKFI